MLAQLAELGIRAGWSAKHQLFSFPIEIEGNVASLQVPDRCVKKGRVLYRRADFKQVAARMAQSARTRPTQALAVQPSTMPPSCLKDKEESQPLLQDVVDSMGGSFERWPLQYRKAAQAASIGFSKDKYNSGCGRHGFCLFCVHNGCDPCLLVRWLLRCNCINRDAWPEVRATLQRLAQCKLTGAQHSTWDLQGCCPRNPKLPEGADVTPAIALIEDIMQSVEPADGSKRNGAFKQALEGAGHYYNTQFPFQHVAQLLNHPSSPVQLREVSVDQRRRRTRPMLSLQQLRRDVCWHATSLHAGAAYDPTTQEVRNDGPLGVELVFEIDELPSGIPEEHRWRWMRHAVGATARVLKARCGFQSLFAFASGNRGPHIWVLDLATGINATHESRRQLLADLEKHRGLEYEQLYDDVLYPFYEEVLIAPSCCGGLELPFRNLDRAAIWKLTFPVFDAQVLLRTDHLHRVPFSIHDKSGRIAIPFDIDTLEGMPSSLADMPRPDDPHIARLLDGPLKVLHAAVARRCGSSSQMEHVDRAIEPVEGAPWLLRETARRESRKRKRQAEEAEEGKPADGEVQSTCSCSLPPTVAPLAIDMAAAKAWVARLRRAQTNDGGGRDADVAAESVCRRTRSEGKDWRGRLEREARRVEELLAAVGESGQLVGKTYEEGDGRTRTDYPQLGKKMFWQGFTFATRHAVTGNAYAEVDLSSAHLAIAWGACVLHFGEDAASERCPSLRLAAVDKDCARGIVAQQGGTSIDQAKRCILATLNQEEGDGRQRCAFLAQLLIERRAMTTALLNHPKLTEGTKASIEAKARASAKYGVTRLSLLFQTLEGMVLKQAASVLDSYGFETVGWHADGIMIGQRAGAIDDADAAERLQQGLAEATAAIAQTLSVHVAIDIERAFGGDLRR